MGLFNKHKKAKNERPSSTYSTASTAPLTPNMPQRPLYKSHFSDFSQVSVLEEKDKKYKRTIRILRFISRLASLILSAVMVAIFAFALAKYYITKSKTVSSGQPVWPPSPVLWPTYMLFGISLVTLLMNFFTLVAYCCGVGAANKTHTVGSILGFLFMGIHVVAWIVAAGAFRMGSNGIDLWGWTCGSEADKIEEQVQSFLDFGQLCTMQGAGWYTSICQAGLYLLTFIITLLVARRASTKKQVVKIRQSLSMEMETSYPSHGHLSNSGGYPGQETGTVYTPGTGKRYIPIASHAR